MTLPRVFWGFEPRELVKGRWVTGMQEPGEPQSCLVLLLSLSLLECLTSSAAPGHVPLLLGVPRNTEVLSKYRASWFA